MIATTYVRVAIWGADEDFAAELHAAYGDRIELTVGRFRYPFDRTSPAPPRVPHRIRSGQPVPIRVLAPA